MTSVNGVTTKTPEKIGPVTVFVGENEAGKTARLKAITIALLGHDPDLGVQPGSTIQYGGKSGLSVSLAFDNGTSTTRIFTRKSGKVVESGAATIEVPPVMLNAAEYFDLGNKDRMRAVFNLYGQVDEGLLEKCVDRVNAITMIPHTEFSAAKISELAGFIRLTWNDAAKTKSCSERLPVVVRALRDKINLLRSSKEAKSALSSERSDAGAIAVNPSQELRAAELELISANDAVSQLHAKRSAWEASVKKRAELEAVISGAPPKSQQELDAINAELENLQQLTQSFSSLSSAADADLRQAKHRVSTLATEWRRIQKNLEDLSAQASIEDKCPTCGSSGGEWQSIKENHAAEIQSKIAALNVEFNNSKAEYQKASEDVQRKSEIVATEKTKDEEHRIRVARLNELLAAMKLHQSETLQIEKAKSSLESLSAAEFTEQDNLELGVANGKVASAKAAKNAAMEKLQAFNRYQADRAAAAKLIEECESLDAEIEITKAAVCAVESVQEEEVDAIFEKLMAHANRFSSGILRAPIEFQDGDVGITVDGQFISRTLCGKERQIIQLAMCASLAANSPFKLLIVDEFSVFTPKTQRQLLERIVSLVNEGVIDQFIACGTSCVDVEGVTTIECRRAE